MNYLEKLVAEESRLMDLLPVIEKITGVVTDAARKGNVIFTCGNGGSASDADHIAAELLKSFMIKRPISKTIKASLEKGFGQSGSVLAEKLEGGVKAISLNAFSVLLSAFGNDVEWNLGYAQLLNVLGSQGDVLIGISCSGNAVNILNSLYIARVKGITSVLLTGKKDGICSKYADIVLKAPADATYRIQEYHCRIYHAICAQVEHNIFKNSDNESS